jgi:hypothetical protein
VLRMHHPWASLLRVTPGAYFCDADDAGEGGILREWDTIRWGKPIELNFPQVLGRSG